MYLVANKTKKSLTIADLKVVLGPNKAIDLDVSFSREQTEKSEGLK